MEMESMASDRPNHHSDGGHGWVTPLNQPDQPLKSAGHDLEKKTNVLKRPEGRCWKISHDSIFRIEIGYRYIAVRFGFIKVTRIHPKIEWDRIPTTNLTFVSCDPAIWYMIPRYRLYSGFVAGFNSVGSVFRWKKKHLGPETKSLE